MIHGVPRGERLDDRSGSSSDEIAETLGGRAGRGTMISQETLCYNCHISSRTEGEEAKE